MLEQLDPTVYLSLAFVFGIASQFRAMDGESFLRRLVSLFERRVGLVFGVVGLVSLVSPLILNDVVVIILTPVILGNAKRYRMDVAPLLVAEITFTNISSSLTPLGNPQNILLWSASGATFLDFVAGTFIPLLISGGIASMALILLLRGHAGQRETGNPPLPDRGAPDSPGIYLLLVVAIILACDALDVASYAALGASFLVGFPFMVLLLRRHHHHHASLSSSLRAVAREFDLRSLLILYAFVGSVTLVSITFAPALDRYAAPAAEGIQPYSALFVGALSSLISNVPATQLIVSVASVSPQVAPRLATAAGLAGNLDPIASFANILALLMARRAGLPLRRTILLQSLVGLAAFIPALL